MTRAREVAPALEVRDLRVRFRRPEGPVTIVDGISFAVRPGRTLGLVGESGCGKTVSALAVMGLLEPAAQVEGQVLLDGRDLLSASADEVRRLRGDRIAMVFQSPLLALHPLRTVGDQLVEAVRAHRTVGRRAAQARAVELLGLVGMPDPAGAAGTYAHRLSGGMRQRAMIAMALINEPRVLIADEPTTALDVTVQDQVLSLLERLRDELDMAVVLITHDLGVVAETAQDVAVVYAGRVVERAPAMTLFTAPEHPYTWSLLGSIPRVDGPRAARLLTIPGAPPDPAAPPAGCRFHPRCPYVREAHRHRAPVLEPAGDADGHEVACLLPAQTRRALWHELHSRDAAVSAAALER